MRIVLAALIAMMPVTSMRALSRADADARSVEIYRTGLDTAVAEMEAVAAERSKEMMLSADEKQRVRTAWSSFLDYLLALDSIGAYHRELKAEPSLVVAQRCREPALVSFLCANRLDVGKGLCAATFQRRDCFPDSLFAADPRWVGGTASASFRVERHPGRVRVGACGVTPSCSGSLRTGS